MNYKYRLVENEDEGSFSRIKAEPKVTLITPNVNAALAALGDIKNYGEYAVTNARQDSNVEKNIEQNFGPKNPKIKTEQEKLFATKSKEEWINYFAEKQRKANLEYRMGYRYLNTGLSFIDNNGRLTNINEYGISFGIGIPKLKEYWDGKKVIMKSMIILNSSLQKLKCLFRW
jgi:hypothetical protein